MYKGRLMIAYRRICDYAYSVRVIIPPASTEDIMKLTIKMKLKDIVRLGLADCVGLNPWCINEGADSEDTMDVEIEIDNIKSIRKPE